MSARGSGSPVHLGFAVGLWLAFAPAAWARQAEDTIPDSQARSTEPAGDERGFLEEGLDRMGRLRQRGVLFEMGSIRSGSGLAAGVEGRRERMFGTPIGVSLRGAWSVYGSREYDFRTGIIRGRDYRAELKPVDSFFTSQFSTGPHLAFGTSLYVHVRERRYERADFYGLGQDADEDARSSYGIRGRSTDLVLQWQSNRHLGVSARAGTLDLSVAPSSRRGVPSTTAMYSAAEAPGVGLEQAFRTAGAAVTLDFRHPDRWLSRGTFAAVGLWHATPSARTSGVGSWTRLVADVRQFIGWNDARHVVAIHGALSARLGDTTLPTPFYLQPSLGGGQTVRGLESYRLRGETAWTVSTEYRWQAHKWVQVVPFVDAGAVAQDFDRLGRTRPEVSPGLGLRATWNGQVIGRLEVAHARDGARLVLAVNAPF